MSDNRQLPVITDEQALTAAQKAAALVSAKALPIDMDTAAAIGMWDRAHQDPAILSDPEEVIKAAFATKLRRGRRFTCHAYGVALTPGDQDATIAGNETDQQD